MALQLLERNRPGAARLSKALEGALESVGNCAVCRTLTEEAVCRLCASSSRDASLCCVVESPGDVFAIEQAGSYRGQYFVLMGHLSPIDGIGPEQLGLDELFTRAQNGAIKELILACNPTVEGDATAYYIADNLRGTDVIISRIAHGVPVGGELEYVDGGTLSHALAGRKPMGRSGDAR
jgi:recombination protein RecR